MNRTEWKALSRRLRRVRYERRQKAWHDQPETYASERFWHLGGPWFVRVGRGDIEARASMLVDRPLRAALLEELRWAAHYRRAAASLPRYGSARPNNIRAARSCLIDCRDWRETKGSYFHRLPAA